MIKQSITFLALASILLYFTYSCTSEEENIQSAEDNNTAPLVSAGIDLNVITGLPVKLDGSDSYDPDGDALDYLWSFQSRPPGSTATLSDAESENNYT